MRKLLTKDKMILKSNAHQNPSTVKPDTREEVNNITTALTTKVNNPKVKMFIGSVNRSSNGFTIMLTMPKTSEATSAVEKFAICTPGST